jgi:excisionase family DNA binding protein
MTTTAPTQRNHEARSDAVIDTTRLTYTVEEVARLLNLSRGMTYQYVREGVIPAERIGRRWLIPRKRLHAWLDGQRAGE